MKEEGALKRLWKFMTDRSGVPRITIIIPVLIYEIFSYVVSSASRNGAVLTIGGNQLPVTAFSGVFTALSNICIIIMVVLYRKAGMFVALVLSLAQFPMQIMGVIVDQYGNYRIPDRHNKYKDMLILYKTKGKQSYDRKVHNPDK